MLEKLFKKLGYNRQNGLYIFSESEKNILDNFPSRISRVLIDVIKPYAIFSLNSYKENEEDHVKPFNNPLILFYDNPSEDEYNLIPKHSFNLSRSPIIIINRDNNIEIFNGFDFSENDKGWLKSIEIDHNLLSISKLRSGKGWKSIHEKYFTKIKTVDRYLLSNITDARRILIARENDFPAGNLAPDVANRLIGRLIFIRYLIDRSVTFNDQDILLGSNKTERQESLNQLLLDHNMTYDFFDYINKKFKGDLFPLEFKNQGFPFLERDYVRKENLEVLHYLFTCSNMFKGNKLKGYTVQRSLFNVYDFEIIPVELISNIYESFLGNTTFSKGGEVVTKLSKQNQVKAFYTPPFLVDYVLSQTVKPHLEKSNDTNCKILDPSCGSGIFLVESLRQIIDKEIKIEACSGMLKKELISNDRLWELLEDNIYGIDIDQNAIEITIFSLYITLLDYKTHPKEIENFEFRPLRSKNLFGGSEADFFNKSNKFNELFQKNVKLDFIVGNPPWGAVLKSNYVNYIKERAFAEKQKDPKAVSLRIGNKEISQAFMVRADDLIQSNAKTKICLIVTGKNLYNSDKSAVGWRKYFLTNYNVHQCFDLFGVNNKIAGGKQIFDNANQPPAILLYSKKTNDSKKNVVKHIVARANLYYHYFKTIVIEKNDVKLVNQKLFLADDKLWKIMMYGNSLDYLFIKKIKHQGSIVSETMKKSGLQLKGGFKSKDSNVSVEKRKDTTSLWDYDYIEVEGEKGLKQYEVSVHKTFKQKLEKLNLIGAINSDLRVPQIADKSVFKGVKLLIKKGLDQYLSHRAVSAVFENNCVFSATVASISPISGYVSKEDEDILYSMSAIFNSKLFTYFLLMTSSSFGAGRNRVNYKEFLEMPFVTDSELSHYSREIHKSIKGNFMNQTQEQINVFEELIENKIDELYKVSPLEKELINYALDVSVPIMKRADFSSDILPSIFKTINKNNKKILSDYCDVFINHFSKRFNKFNKIFAIDIFINEDFIALHFIIIEKRKKIIKYNYEVDINSTVVALGELGVNEVSSDLFTQQDIRGFNKDSFYLIKPNIIKNWHLAMAHTDLIEFIEAIASAEINKVKQKIN